MAVAAHPLVNDLRHLDHPGNPQNQRDRHEQREAHSQETEAARTPMDFAVGGHTVDRFHELFAGQMRSGGVRARIGVGQDGKHVEPVQPCQEAHLKNAERALAVVEN